MKKLLFSLILITIIGFAGQHVQAAEGKNDTDEKKIEVLDKNMDKDIKRVDNIIKEALKANQSTEEEYTVDSCKKFKKELKKIDITSENYERKLISLYEKTAPDVIVTEICEQSADIANSVNEISKRVPDDSYSYTTEDGEEYVENIYQLESGAMVVVSGEDMQDDTYEVKGNDLFSPCSISTATWISDKSIMKKNGARRYTANYKLLVGGTVKGHLSVTNHYTVNKGGLTFREANIWDYSGESPLSVKIHKKAKLNSSKYAKFGETLSVVAEFYVTCKREENITLSAGAGADVGITVNQSVSTNVHWEKKQSRLHKLYANVKVITITDEGAKVRQSGKCTFSK